MDLYSQRIIGWVLDKRMTVALVKCDVNGNQPEAAKEGLIFHNDSGSHDTSRSFAKQLKTSKIKASMNGKGTCWENAVVEIFFGSLKYEW